MSLDISDTTLKKFASGCDAKNIAPALKAACAKYKINTPRRLTHFLGHVYHESGAFRHMVENLDYRATRLMEVWPKRFPTLEKAAPYASNPVALANLVYGGRYGNTQPGDGWRYRGRGFIQLTFKDNYRAASKWSDLDLVGEPEQAGEFVGAAHIAAAFWADKDLNEVADGADEAAAILKETKLINGGTKGLAERKAAIGRAQQIWS